MSRTRITAEQRDWLHAISLDCYSMDPELQTAGSDIESCNPVSADTREGYGRQVSFTIDQGKSATAWMKRRVDSKLGRHYYSHRMSGVEPVFANIGSQKRLNHLSLRGREKVHGRRRLYCLVHNIEKLMRYGAIC